MSELRVNGKSEDGLYLSLLDSDGKEFSVRISDTLRSTVNQPRLMSVQDEEAAPISVKEIQRRLRTGESPESIAQDGNISWPSKVCIFWSVPFGLIKCYNFWHNI